MDTKPKALAVDDEQDNLDLLKRALRRDYDVLISTSPSQALNLFDEHDFDIILSDQRMPEMLGTEFLAETIKRQPSALRFLITGYSDIDAVINAVNKGSIHRYVKKPWRKEELLREIMTAKDILSLTTDNQRMIVELKEANDKLEKQKQLLLQDLDTRSRELLHANEQLQELNAHLQGQSLKDGLTGLYNHRAFQQRLREEVSRALRTKSPLSLVFLDVDNFKHYNDTHGHQAGDELLQIMADLLQSTSRITSANVRSSDVVARYGGEEFAVILPDTPLEGAIIKAGRIQKAVATKNFRGMETQPLKCVTVSIGVACVPEDAQTAEALIEHADTAMYAAKRSGKNRVLSYREIEPN